MSVDHLKEETRGFEQDPRKLNHVLSIFCTQQVQRDRNTTSSARAEVTKIVEAILEEVKRIDSNFDFDPINMGSDFQGVAVKSSSDFDILLRLKGFPPLTKGFEHYNDPVGWATIGNGSRNYGERLTASSGKSWPSHSSKTNQSSFGMAGPTNWKDTTAASSGDKRPNYSTKGNWPPMGTAATSASKEWPSYFMKDSYLSSAMVRSSFARCVSEAIVKLRYSDIIDMSTHGAAVQLSIRFAPLSGSYEVDLVPAIKDASWPGQAQRIYRWPTKDVMNDVVHKGTYYVAKLYPDKFHQRRDAMWCISFCEAENTITRLSDPGCRRMVLRILKALNEQHIGAPVKSYHLKSIWMHECEKYPEDWHWTQEKLGERFLGLLSRLQDCLERGDCRQFFITEINLFECSDKQHLRGLGNNVRKIKENPANYLLDFD